MTLPTPDHDLLIRMDAKLDVALSIVNNHSEAIDRIDNTVAGHGIVLVAVPRHSEAIDRIDNAVTDHGTRLTILETQDQRDDQETQKTYSGKTVFWVACAPLVVVLIGVIGFIVNSRG